MAAESEILSKFAEKISEDLGKKFNLSSLDSVNRLILQELGKIRSVISSASKKLLEETKVSSAPLKPDEVSIKPNNPSQTVVSGFSEEALKAFMAPPLMESLKKIHNTLTHVKEGIRGINSNIKELTASQKSNLAPESELAKVEKPTQTIVVGFSEEALKAFMAPPLLDGLKKIYGAIGRVTEGIKGISSNIKEMTLGKGGEGFLSKLLPGGIMSVLGGSTIVLAGLASLVAAFNTNGALKGTLELIGKGGIRGGLTVIAKKLAEKASLKLLAKIPVIGSLISLGFAIQRFSNGDVVGGMLEIGSGIASLFPGVGTVISIGIDVLQAILDAKAGGSSAEASKKKSGILADWTKPIAKWVQKNLRDYPVIGPLVKAVEHFQKDEWLKGIKQLAYIYTPLELLGAFLGDTETSPMVQTTAAVTTNVAEKLGNWIHDKLKDVPFVGPIIRAIKHIANDEWEEGLSLIPGGKMLYDFFQSKSPDIKTTIQEGKDIFAEIKKWFNENVEDLPIIGAALRSIKLFASGEILKGFKEMVYAIPFVEPILAFFGDEQAKSNIQKQNIALGKVNWNGIAEWMQYRFGEAPIIGPALKALQSIKDGRFLEGIKQLVYMFPPFELLGAFLGDDTVTASAQNATSALRKFDWNGITEWMQDKFGEAPIIGPALKALQSFKDGRFLEGIKQLAYMFPPFELLGAFLGDDTVTASAQNAAVVAFDIGKSITNFFKDLIDSIMQKFLEKIPETIGWKGFDFDLRKRVSKLIGMDSSSSIEAPKSAEKVPKTAEAPKEFSKPTPTPPILPSNNTQNNSLLKAESASFLKMESHLESIANNTLAGNQNISNLIVGFNGLVKALEKTLNESLNVPLIQSVSPSKDQPMKPSSSQYANTGSNDIATFRSSIIEGSRFQPA